MFRSRPAPSTSLLVAVVVAVGCNREAASDGATVRANDSTSAADTSVQLTAANVSPPSTAPDTPLAPEPRRPVGHPVPKPPTAKKVNVPPASQNPAGRDSVAAPAAPAAAQDKGLSYDPATNTVTFELIAGPFTFNGYRNGEGSLVVPPKANMVINFVNKDGTPHSAIVISGEGPIPNAASDPAIPRAYTNKALEGLPQEAGDVMRFPMPETGTYRIFCGVPGHGLSGMWIWLKVDPAAKAPSFGPTKA
ncbi:MAG TPA: sulfocyanin-like copper-binding protein [Gemmatimonadales bacterium]